MAEDAEGRDTYQGDVETLKQTMQPHADAGGVSFCTYPDEQRLTTKAKMHPESIVAHGNLLKDLRSLQQNLTFPRGKIEAALKLLFPVEKFRNEKEWEDWWVTLGRRIRNMSRCTAQAENKLKPPLWIKQLPWHAEPSVMPAQPAASSAAAPPPQPADAPWQVGWNKELHIAYRHKDNMADLEMSLPITVDPGDEDSAVLKAKFHDGFESQVPDMLVGAYRLGRRNSKGSKASAVLWEAVQAGTHHKLIMSQRLDRSLLISLYEQSRQVCQVRADVFADISAEDQRSQRPADHPAIVAGVAFMAAIGQKYATGELKKWDLFAERDRMMKDKFPEAITKRKMIPSSTKDDESPPKKPAAFTTGAEEEQKEQKEDENTENEEGKNAVLKRPSACVSAWIATGSPAPASPPSPAPTPAPPSPAPSSASSAPAYDGIPLPFSMMESFWS